MQLIDQMKTTQGRVPGERADVYTGDDGKVRIHFLAQSAAECGRNAGRGLNASRDVDDGFGLSGLAGEGAAARAAASDHGKTERKQPIIEDLAFLWDDAGRIA